MSASSHTAALPDLQAARSAAISVSRSCVPTDIVATRRAIAGLFRARQLTPPPIRLVESPLKAGLLAAHASRFGGPWRHALDQRYPTTWQTSASLRWAGAAGTDYFDGGHLEMNRRWVRDRLHALEELGAGSWSAWGSTRAVLEVLQAAMSESVHSLQRPRAKVMASADFDRAAIVGRRTFGALWDESVTWMGEQPTARLFVNGFLWRRTSRAGGGIQPMSPHYAGQLDVLHPYLALWQDVFGRRLERRTRTELDRWLRIARSCGPWWVLERAILMSDRPLVLRTDALDRPHALDGPAIVYRDGWAIDAVDGEFTGSRLLSAVEVARFAHPAI